MFKLAWDVQELGELNESGRKLVVSCANLKAKVMQADYDRISDNFPRQLSAIKQELLSFTKQVVKVKAYSSYTHSCSDDQSRGAKQKASMHCLFNVSLGDMAVRRICDGDD